MKKILVATDFSACALNAMEYALELAKIMKLEIVAIHAIGSTEGIDNNIFSTIYMDDYRNAKKQALKEWAASFTATDSFKDVAVSTVCEVGTVSGVITKYIENEDVELLVMGTMGSTGISSIFGHNANVMVSKTKTPTLIVPLESKFSMKPVITLATDFESKLSPEDINILNELLVASEAAKLDVLNIIEGNAWKTNAEGEENLRKLIHVAELDFNYTNESNTTEGIMNFVISNKTDILCLVNRTHSMIYRIFNLTTVDRVMNKSIKAVLVLHE